MAEATTKSNPRRVVAQGVRLSYCYVAESKENDHGDQEYSTQLLIPKGGVAHKAIHRAVMAALIASPLCGGDKAKAERAMKNPQIKKPIRDPEAEGRDGAEYEGMMFANAKTNAKKGRPGVILKNGTKLTDPDEIQDAVYSGCWAHVSVTAYYFDNSGNKGIALALNNVMKQKDDDRLDGSVAAEDEFADFVEEGDDGFDDDGFDDSPPSRKGGKLTQQKRKPAADDFDDDDFTL